MRIVSIVTTFAIAATEENETFYVFEPEGRAWP